MANAGRWLVLALAMIGIAGAAEAGSAETRRSLTPYIAPQTQVRLPDGRLFNFVCMGDGAPLAVLDTGLGDWSLDWARLQPDLAGITRICIADRAGYGFSSPGPLPRDSTSETKDLEDALRAAGLRPPFLVMGHSLGGLNARLFAYRNPGQVAGLLLIDPSVSIREFGTPDEFAAKMNLPFYAHCAAEARAGRVIPGRALTGDTAPCVSSPDPQWPPATAAGVERLRTQPSVFETALAEFTSAYSVDVDQVAAARRKLGDVPMIILTEDAAHFRMLQPWFADKVDAVYARWLAGHQDEARDSTQGVDRVVAGAGHDIETDRPEAVVSAFRELVEAARHSGGAAKTGATGPTG